MSIHDYSDLNEVQLDVLREIGNIGSGNAATALASMLSHPIGIAVPKINILDYDQVVRELGGPEQMIVGILLTLDGDVHGMMMFLLQQDFARITLSTLLGVDIGDSAAFNDSVMDEEGGYNDMGVSAIKEVGNIMAASYVNAISDMTGLQIEISVPDLCIDMAGSIVSVPAILYSNISDKVILIQDEFSSQTNNVSSHILMIPDVDSLKKIMTNLGIEI